jgi:transposase
MPPKTDAAHAAVLRVLVTERDERTLAELAAAYHAATGIALSLHAVRRACQRLDLRRKKKQPQARRADA